MLRSIFLLFLGLTLTAGSARALEPRDENVIRQVIVNQMNAFARDDGALALSFASPTIKNVFRSPDAFINMVKRGYHAVYRPRSVAFEEIVEHGGKVLQPIRVQDLSGQLFQAIYDMQVQSDGDWKINGVQIRPDRRTPQT